MVSHISQSLLKEEILLKIDPERRIALPPCIRFSSHHGVPSGALALFFEADEDAYLFDGHL
ncbi:MAG: hypothetical protein K2Q10_00965 [Rhodospirillales bacterium]|nr:hypothetical protein [Rhodospirillales bacterium]